MLPSNSPNGLLGQLLEPLTYPRRALWSAVGLPEHGSDLLGYLGMNPQAPLTRMLGVGVEMAGDPLTYAGGYLAHALAHGAEAAEAGAEAGSVMGGKPLGGINPGMAASLDDLLLAAVNGQGNQDQQQPLQPTQPMIPPAPHHKSKRSGQLS